jgi:hypothetical protein
LHSQRLKDTFLRLARRARFTLPVFFTVVQTPFLVLKAFLLEQSDQSTIVRTLTSGAKAELHMATQVSQ